MKHVKMFENFDLNENKDLVSQVSSAYFALTDKYDEEEMEEIEDKIINHPLTDDSVFKILNAYLPEESGVFASQILQKASDEDLKTILKIFSEFI